VYQIVLASVLASVSGNVSPSVLGNVLPSISGNVSPSVLGNVLPSILGNILEYETERGCSGTRVFQVYRDSIPYK